MRTRKRVYKRGWSGPIANQQKGWDATRTHGMAKTPTYRSWAQMIQRCTNPNNKRFADYGGAGITVCQRWFQFASFLADMGERPAGKSIDRFPNQKGNYEPGNCKWSTRREQQNNMRSNRLIHLNGEVVSASEASRKLGIKPNTALCRLNRGWTIEEAVNRPIPPASSAHPVLRLAHGAVCAYWDYFRAVQRRKQSAS